MFIDTHFHLSKRDDQDIDAVIKQANQHRVERLIVSGCDKVSIVEVLEYPKRYSNLFLTIGFHPSEAEKVTDDDLLWLEQQIKNNKAVVGIGEIGLDYHYDKDHVLVQKELFRKQLDIAVRLHKPVVIHSRDATLDTLQILKEYSLKGVIHCFSGSVETAKEYLRLGFCLGIGGVVTFKNSKLYEVIEQIDLNHIVLETDSPYLAPEPYRGSQNEPKNIPIIAQRVAEIKHISIDQVEKITTQVASSLFDLSN